MKLRKRFWVSIALVAVLVAMTVQTAAAADVIKWKAQTYWPAGVLGYKAFADFTDRVKDMTGGRLEIKPFPGNAIVPYNELMDATKSNIIQGCYSWAGYAAGKQPAFSVMTDLIGAWKDEMEVFDFYHYGGGLDYLNELYKPFGVYSVGPVIGQMEVIPSKVPISKPEDFKGLKVRSPEGMLADLLKKMGASVVVLASSDMYQALDKGVVDAGDYSCPTLNYALGLHKVSGYFNYPGFHSLPQGDFAVNQKAWDELPDDIKAILKVAVRDWCIDFSQQLRLSDNEAVQKMVEAGSKPMEWGPEAMQQVRNLCAQVWSEWAAKSPECAKAVELQKTFIEMKLGRKFGQ